MVTGKWTRSGFCDSSACVEVYQDNEGVLIRNSEQPDKAISFSVEEWGAFMLGIRVGEFDVVEQGGGV